MRGVTVIETIGMWKSDLFIKEPGVGILNVTWNCGIRKPELGTELCDLCTEF